MVVQDLGSEVASWFDVAHVHVNSLLPCQFRVGVRTRQPDDFNGYGYFFVRLYCTGLGFQANIVEEYGLLTALQHILSGF